MFRRWARADLTMPRTKPINDWLQLDRHRSACINWDRSTPFGLWRAFSYSLIWYGFPLMQKHPPLLIDVVI